MQNVFCFLSFVLALNLQCVLIVEYTQVRELVRATGRVDFKRGDRTVP